MPASGRRLIALCAAAVLAAIVVASLIPADMQLRSGLNWLIEHFLAFFVAALVLCLAWPRPVIVAAALMALSALLEMLQGLTPDRVPDLPTALSGAAGAVAGALAASLSLYAARRLRGGNPA
jgi:peptidoglycan/LPS O-acetylase OafA/YrhL